MSRPSGGGYTKTKQINKEVKRLQRWWSAREKHTRRPSVFDERASVQNRHAQTKKEGRGRKNVPRSGTRLLTPVPRVKVETEASPPFLYDYYDRLEPAELLADISATPSPKRPHTQRARKKCVDPRKVSAPVAPSFLSLA